jgi:Holliday junction resolvase RusA-like endonuclease
MAKKLKWSFADLEKKGFDKEGKRIQLELRTPDLTPITMTAELPEGVREGVKLFVRPIPKPRMTQRDKWAKRPVVLRYFEYKDKLRAEVLKNNIELGVKLSLTFIIAIPKSKRKKKNNWRAKIGTPHQERPDLDNLIKAFKDALYKEDSVVWKYGPMEKIWGEEDVIIYHEMS